MSKRIRDYTVIETFQENGTNANIYLVKDDASIKYVLKEFSKKVMPYVGYSKYNHFGRRREGAALVFDEIKKASDKFDFLTKFYERFRWNNKWCVVIDYFEGETLGNFIKKNQNNSHKLETAIYNFAIEVSVWHRNGFAHGDPHLENVMINSNTLKVKLIDYSQIHHQSFDCCNLFNCFEKDGSSKRFQEDLVNQGKMGKGFLSDLREIDQKYDHRAKLVSIFEEIYTAEMSKHTKVYYK